MYEFCYDYIRSKYGRKVNLCYMGTENFVYEIEIEDFYGDIAKDVEKRFGTSGYSKDDNRPLPIGENKKVIALMKDELGGNIMTEFVALSVKMYAYRKIGKEVEEKRCKGTKSVWFLKALCLMIAGPASLMVKRYIGSKHCLRIRSMRCTRLISRR